MPYRSDTFTKGQYYHVYNRGAGKKRIFLNDGNYDYLLLLINRYHQKYGATAIAFCLMPNHYHFLLRQETDEPLSKFMGVMFNTYVQALNLQQGRSGTLFEGRFKHVHVEKWEYLLHLCRYIHLNPVKANLVAHAEEWPYSNYREWIGVRNATLSDQKFIRDHYPDLGDYARYITDGEDEKKSYKHIAKYMID